MVKVYIALFTLGEDQWILNESKIGCKSESEHCSCILLGTNIVMLPQRAACYALEILFATAFFWFLFLCVIIVQVNLTSRWAAVGGDAHFPRPAAPSPLVLCFGFGLERLCRRSDWKVRVPNPLILILLVRMIIYLKLYSLTLFTTFSE